MFIVPSIMCIGGPATVMAAIATGIYAVQIFLIILLIYRVACLISEYAQYKSECPEEDKDDEERLSRLLADMNEEQQVDFLISREKRKRK